MYHNKDGTLIVWEENYRDALTEKLQKQIDLETEYTRRFFYGWKSCECDDSGRLKPFSQSELEHICLLNDHLKCLTLEAIAKAQRITDVLGREYDNGNCDFEDYEVCASIGMAYGDDCDAELEMLIRHVWKLPEFEVIHFSFGMSKQEQAKLIDETIKFYNNEQSSIGRLWNEMWDTHHISLSWAFGHFFNHLNVFTMEDIMKIQPENFETGVKVYT